MASKKHIIVVVLCTLIGISLILLSFFPNEREEAGDIPMMYGGTYRYAHSETITSLDPRKTVFAVSFNIMHQIFDPLINVSEDLELVPSICSSWEVADDGRRFTCYIAKGILFHDGRELTSRDVVFSLHYISKKGGRNLDIESMSLIDGIKEFWQGRADEIRGIRSVGKYAVQIDLVNSCPHFAYIIASSRYVALPNNLNELTSLDFFKKPIGTGPFMFVSKKDSKVVLEANRTYHNGRPYLDGLAFVYMPNKDSAVEAFKAGHVDDLSNYNISSLPEGMTNARHVLSESYSNLIVFPNNSRRPFNNRLLRELLFSVIDRERIVGTCYPRSAVSRTIIPRGIIGYDGNAPSMQYDMKRARSLIKTIRRQGIAMPKVTIWAMEIDLNSCTRDLLNENFKEIGIPWMVQYTDSEMLAELFFNGSMDAEIELISVRNEDAHSILRFFNSASSENLARIDDELVDRLLSEAKYETEPMRRVKLYRQIDSLVTNMDYALPIVSPKIYSIWNPIFRRNDFGITRMLKKFTEVSLVRNEKTNQ